MKRKFEIMLCMQFSVNVLDKGDFYELQMQVQEGQPQ